MNEVDKINEQIAQLTAQRESVMLKEKANVLVTPILSPLWLFPMIAITWTFQNPIFIFTAILLFVLCYCLLYVILPNVQKQNNKTTKQQNNKTTKQEQ